MSVGNLGQSRRHGVLLVLKSTAIAVGALVFLLWYLAGQSTLSVAAWFRAAQSGAVSRGRRPTARAVPPMIRVARDGPAAGSGEATLWAARGEYESFQVAISGGASGIEAASVAVSDLEGPAGASVAAGNATLYREHFVFVGRSSPDLRGTNRPLPPGWYADALIPAATPFRVPRRQNQPVWIDLFVPRETPPGAYVGKAIVTADGAALEIPIKLTVWNFSLPLKPSLKSSFGMHEPNASDLRAQQVLLEHKLMPFVISPTHGRKLIDQYGLSTAGLRLTSGSSRSTCTMAPAPSIPRIAAEAAQYPSDLAPYIYSADEIDPCTNLFDTVKHWARNMHAVGIRNLATITPNPLLYDDGTGSGKSAVDIWVLAPPMYDSAPERVAEVKRKGDEVWSYTALVQDSYSPKWEIDFSPVNFRIQPGFISQSLGLTGLLYWRVDLFTASPWTDVQTYTEDSLVFPGEGMLIYPGAEIGVTGPAPSMRLKWIRDGVEDYEYVEVAKSLGRGDWALSVARTVGPDWTNWTQDPAKLEAARLEIGQELDRISTQ